MEKIIKWALLAVVLYFGYTFGRPYIEQLLDQPGMGAGGGATGEAGRCIRLAESASEDFAGKAADFGAPPINADRWSSALQMSYGRVGQARDACSCSEDACRTAGQALDELERLMSEFDSAISGDGQPPMNAARSQERVTDLLARARNQSS